MQDNILGVPQAFQSVVQLELQQEPKAYEFENPPFAIRFDFRFTALIVQLPNSSEEHELVSTWVGRVEDWRYQNDRGEQKTVPVYIREYIYLGNKNMGEARMGSNDGGQDDDPPGRRSTAMEHVVAYNMAFQDGYFVTPTLLTNYGSPHLSVRTRAKYHVLVLYERQESDRLHAWPSADAKDPAGLQEVKRYVGQFQEVMWISLTHPSDLQQRDLSIEDPFVERLFRKECLSVALFDAKITHVVRSFPAMFAAEDETQSKRWFRAVLSLELSCDRDSVKSRILLWVARLEQLVSGNKEREDRLNSFKTAVDNRLIMIHGSREDQMRDLMIYWDCLARHETDPVYKWVG